MFRRCAALVRWTLAVLAAASAAGVDAQPRSRVDLQVGGMGQPNLLLIGATVWSDSRGVALRGLFGSWESSEEALWVQETMYRFRTSSEAVEVDWGVGVVSRGAELGALTLDLLVGPRVLGRFGMKAGLGYLVGLREPGQAVVFKAMGVVALGGR